MTSRFSLIQAPVKDPAVCWITRTSVGPFIDTGVDVSVGKIDRGRIYLSVDAIREMAQIAGLFDENEPASVELKKRQWFEQGYNEAIKELSGDAINRFVEQLSRSSVGSTGGAAVVEPASNFTTAGAAVSGPEGTAGEPLQSDKGSDGPELKSASASRVKRPSRVSADSSNESEYRL